MQDVYNLSDDQKSNIGSMAQVAGKGSLIATILGILGVFSSAGTSLTPKILSMMGAINVIKYININYPPNIKQMFLDANSQL